MDSMTLLFIMLMMNQNASTDTQSAPTNEMDVWKTLILTLPDILDVFGFTS